MDEKLAVDILLSVAEGATYDSEYDGICNTYCCYCDANLSHKDHDRGCLMLLAREAIKDEWSAAVSEKEKRAREAHKKTWAYKVERIPCQNCGKLVKRVGMKQHMRYAGCSQLKSPEGLV